MKKLTFGFLIAMLVVFTGCSQKDVEVTEETKTQPKSVEKKEQTTQDSVQPMQSETQTEQTNSTQNTEPMMEPKKEMVKAETKEKKAPKLNNIYFDFDKFNIRSNMRSVLKSNYSKLEKNEYKGTITLEGHCDERGSDEYNFALGLKRAQSVKTELIDYGVNPAQIKIMSYGENKPLCTKQTKNCWSKNRRVESVLD